MTQKKLIIRIITTPFRAISKAKDFYIRSITECANHANYGAPATSFGTPLSRSSSTSSFASNATNEDLRELIRANSTSSMGDLNITRADLELYIKQHMMNKSSPAIGSRKVPRSVSVGMGRIDEDAAISSFPVDHEDFTLGRKVKVDNLMFPRSKSQAVTSSTKINRFS